MLLNTNVGLASPHTTYNIEQGLHNANISPLDFFGTPQTLQSLHNIIMQHKNDNDNYTKLPTPI